MATILQRFTRALSPSVIGEIAKTAGLEPGLATRGVTAAGHVVLLALADRAALPDGPAAVFRLLPASSGSPMLGELAFIARAGVPTAVLAPVLGARARAIGDRLDRALGFCASSLLPVATAAVVGLTATIVAEQALDEAGLAELLALEAAELLSDASDAVLLVPVTPVAVYTDALTAVREALETISRMNPSEAPRFRRLVKDVAACVAIGPGQRPRRHPSELPQGPIFSRQPTYQGYVFVRNDDDGHMVVRNHGSKRRRSVRRVVVRENQVDDQ
jgi:hypothetical protein